MILYMDRSEPLIIRRRGFYIFNISASIAQGLEHWSCKPGVVSSNLTGGFETFFFILYNEIF